MIVSDHLSATGKITVKQYDIGESQEFDASELVFVSEYVQGMDPELGITHRATKVVEWNANANPTNVTISIEEKPFGTLLEPEILCPLTRVKAMHYRADAWAFGEIEFKFQPQGGPEQ